MKDFENKIRQHMVERGWDDLRPSDLAKSIMIEGAELLEIFQWSNQTQAEVRADADKMEKVKNELADILIYCFDLGVSLEIDMEEIANIKLEKVKQKYLTTIFNPSNKGGGANDRDVYWQVKEAHRANK